ncbi:MAG: hypothetical protein HN576_12290 [Bacteriovoracaceae bacterium]|jgi:hypothetical protein|nr:hypothetical protein [Bacteriovoracaceae bacterium]
MKKLILPTILFTWMFFLAQGCTTHSTNKSVFKAPTPSNYKADYASERFVDRNGR